MNNPKIRTLLSVVGYLGRNQRRRAIFIKPALGKELKKPNMGCDPNVMAVRIMTLPNHTVIPFHMHEGKEKIYRYLGNGTLVVTVINCGIKEFRLKRPGQMLVVPAGCPHFLRYFSRKYEPCCRVVVISSSQNGNDIMWEDATDQLIKNRHLKKHTKK